jgi:hypothetical protein
MEPGEAQPEAHCGGLAQIDPVVSMGHTARPTTIANDAFDPKDARKVVVSLALGTQHRPWVPCAENVPTPSKSSQSSHGVTNGRANKFG